MPEEWAAPVVVEHALLLLAIDVLFVILVEICAFRSMFCVISVVALVFVRV